MKLLVFAHTPPPHHGQSYMVKLMLEGLGGDCRGREKGRGKKEEGRTGPSGESSFPTPATRHSPSAIPLPAPDRSLLTPASGDSPSTFDSRPLTPIECYHVNAQVSDNMEDIGTFRLGKLLLIIRYCIEAIWCRFRYGVRAFYYVPAPGKRAALYRDWIVMLLCRPFFRHRVYHWHASGLGDWLKNEGNWFERWLTHRLLGKPALGISLAIPSMRDALWFRSDRVEIVANGIPDPCPDFDTAIRPLRTARVEARRKLLNRQDLSEAERRAAGGDPQIFRVFYLAHCTRDKGVFEAIEGSRIANQRLREKGTPVRVRTVIAGAFLFPGEESEMKSAIARANDPEQCVEYAGFVGGDEKQRLLAGCDCLCFPTYYSAEGQPVSLLEAMAFGLQIVTTRWRAIPELLPLDHPGFCAARDPDSVADALLAVMGHDATGLRRHFLEGFQTSSHIAALRGVLREPIGEEG